MKALNAHKWLPMPRRSSMNGIGGITPERIISWTLLVPVISLPESMVRATWTAPWNLEDCTKLWGCLGSERGIFRVGAIQHGHVGSRPILWLNLGGYSAVGMGALPVWSLGLCERLLGLGARAGGGETGLRSRPGCLFRRA